MTPITPHLRHPRDPRQSVCGIAAAEVLRWETEDPPRAHTCEDCLTQYEEAARPDDANHPIGDATLIDTLRRIVAERQYAKIDGVLVDVWSSQRHRPHLGPHARRQTATPPDVAVARTDPAMRPHLRLPHRQGRQVMTDRQPQWFHFGFWAFDINAALALIHAAPRDTLALDVTTWASAYGLTRIDDPDRTTVNLLGPTSDGLDRLYAMSTDLTNPVLLGMIRVRGKRPAALLIDGVHRLYHAWRKGVPQLPSYVLTAKETRAIQHDKILGPGGNPIIPPSA